MPKILVTGVNGFVGKHLTRELTQRHCEVVGVGRDQEPDSRIADELSRYYSCDLTKPEEVDKIDLVNVGAVISLAGLARVGDSFKNPEAYMSVNVKVLSVLGESLLRQELNPRVIAISTGAVYESGQEMPLTEDSKIVENGSPYVMSKISMEKAGKSFRSRGLDSVIVRPFNHTGPEQEEGFLLPDLYAKIEKSKILHQPLAVGNLDTQRDYTDVRDVVRAYADLATVGNLSYDTYNVCSGRSLSGRDILAWLQKAMDVSLETKIDESLIRPNDPAEIYGSFKRLNQDTGWSPTIPIQTTIRDFVDSNKNIDLLAA